MRKIMLFIMGSLFLVMITNFLLRDYYKDIYSTIDAESIDIGKRSEEILSTVLNEPVLLYFKKCRYRRTVYEKPIIVYGEYEYVIKNTGEKILIQWESGNDQNFIISNIIKDNILIYGTIEAR
jgi:hypothetical protein